METGGIFDLRNSCLYKPESCAMITKKHTGDRKMEEKVTMEALKKGWRTLNFEVRKRGRLDMSEFKRLFTETYAVLSEMSAADSVRKDCVAMIAEAYLFANTENRELNDSGMPAFVLTERMLNNCVFGSVSGDCNISNVYLIEARKEVYLDFKDVDGSLRKLEAVLADSYWDTF